MLDDGTEIKPLDKLPPNVKITMAGMKAAICEEGQENAFHLLVFPTRGPKGKPVVDTAARGKLRLVLKPSGEYGESEFIWRTPFDSLHPKAVCKRCGDDVSVKWAFCPWCGAKQAEKLAPGPAGAVHFLWHGRPARGQKRAWPRSRCTSERRAGTMPVPLF